MGHGEEQDCGTSTRKRECSRPFQGEVAGNTSSWPEEYRGMSMEERRAVRKAQGRCHQCGAEAEGRSRCPRCADYRKLKRRRVAYIWQSMETAPRDGTHILAAVNGVVRRVAWGKTSHMPLYGFCLADQGVEDFDLCDPTYWVPLPALPKEAA